MSLIPRLLINCTLGALGLIGLVFEVTAVPIQQRYFSLLNHGVVSRQSIASADFNDDGIDEVLVAHNPTSGLGDTARLVVYLQEGAALEAARVFALSSNSETDLHVTEVGSEKLLIAVSKGASLGRMQIFGGWPIRELSSKEIPGWVSGSAVGDVNRDGQAEVLLALGNRVEAYSTSDGALLWTLFTDCQAVAIENLDGDPALEIIVSGSFSPAAGRVFDGATRGLEWTYPAGFGSILATGKIGPQQRKAFAGANTSTGFEVFSADPWSQNWNFNLSSIRSLIAGDTDYSGADEIIATTWPEGGNGSALRVIDSQTRSIRISIAANPAAVDIVENQPQGGPTLLLHPGALAGPFQFPAMSLIDPATGSARHHVFNDATGIGASVIGDFDGNGILEVAMAAGSNARLRIVELHSGQEQWRSPAVGSDFSNPFSISPEFILDAQADADPARELVVLGSGGFNRVRWIVLDGKTREVQLDSGVSDAGPLNSRRVRGGVLLDYDGDGFDDVAFISEPTSTGAIGARIDVFSLRKGLRLWNSGPIGGGFVSARGLFLLRPTSGQAILVAAIREGLRAFGVETQGLLWAHDIPIQRLAVVSDAPGGPEIHIEGFAHFVVADVAVLDAATRVIRRTYQMPRASRALAPVPGGSWMLAADSVEVRLQDLNGTQSGRALRVTSTGSSAPISLYSREYQHDLFIGTPFGFVVSSLIPDGLFLSSFEDE